MNEFRIPTIVLALVFLTAANAVAQVRIAVTGGVARLVEERCDRVNVPGSGGIPGSLGNGGLGSATCAGETHYEQAKSHTGLSAGLSGIIPLTGAFGIELGGVYSQWQRGSGIPALSHLTLRALGRVNLPWTENWLRAFLIAGPSLTLRRERRLDLGLAAGAELEYAVDDDMGVTLGTVYTHGMRNLATHTDMGEYMRLRNVAIRSGLLFRFR